MRERNEKKDAKTKTRNLVHGWKVKGGGTYF